MLVQIQELHDYVESLLTKPFGDIAAKSVAEYLMWAEMSGISTQGLVKLTGPNAMNLIKIEGEPVIDHESSSTMLYNGKNSPAPYVASLLADAAVSLAEKSGGIGMAGYHNVQSSGGALAYYCERASNRGFIGIMMARSPACVAAFGGIDPVFGTNPFAFSAPSTAGPVSFDGATSGITMLGMILADRRGETIPIGLAVDSDGNGTTSPANGMAGALLPFGGHKSSGIGLLVELLGGALVGAAVGEKTGEWGSLFIAIKPNVFGGQSAFMTAVEGLAQKVRSGRTGPSGVGPRMPGDRAHASHAECVQTGRVEISNDLLTDIGFLKAE